MDTVKQAKSTMNIKFRHLGEYKAFLEAVKLRSLQLKNRNIHHSCIMRNLRKEFPRLALVDAIVEKYYNDNVKAIDNDNIDCSDATAQIMQLVRQVIPVSEIAFKPVKTYVNSAFIKLVDRKIFEKKRKVAKEIMRNLLKKRIRSEKIADENDKTSKIASCNIGMIRIADLFSNLNFKRMLFKTLRSAFMLFCKDDRCFEEIANGGDIHESHVGVLAKKINCALV